VTAVVAAVAADTVTHSNKENKKNPPTDRTNDAKQPQPHSM